MERFQELLRLNQTGGLFPAEGAELEEIALLDQLVTAIKARSTRRQS